MVNMATRENGFGVLHVLSRCSLHFIDILWNQEGSRTLPWVSLTRSLDQGRDTSNESSKCGELHVEQVVGVYLVDVTGKTLQESRASLYACRDAASAVVNKDHAFRKEQYRLSF
jgi:hypothetical protein